MRTPAGGIEVDSSGRTAGRGAYVCRTPECIDNAIKKGAFNRALNTPLPPDLRAALVVGIGDDMNTTIEGGARGQE